MAREYLTAYSKPKKNAKDEIDLILTDSTIREAAGLPDFLPGLPGTQQHCYKNAPNLLSGLSERI